MFIYGLLQIFHFAFMFSLHLTYSFFKMDYCTLKQYVFLLYQLQVLQTKLLKVFEAKTISNSSLKRKANINVPVRFVGVEMMIVQQRFGLRNHAEKQ